MKRISTLLLIALFWLAVWQLLAHIVGSPLLLPSPAATLRRLASLLAEGEFWLTLALSLLRILCGIVLGTLLGTLLAVCTSRFALLRALFSPLLTVIKTTPVVSFIILLILWLGRDVLPSAIVVLMVLPLVWANVSAGIAGVDPQLLELARVYRFPRLRTLRRIYIPSVRPHFLAAARSALGLAWKAGIAAEVLTVPQRSIGRALSDSKLYLETVDLFAWTLTVILCSLLIEKLLVSLLEKIGGRMR